MKRIYHFLSQFTKILHKNILYRIFLITFLGFLPSANTIPQPMEGDPSPYSYEELLQQAQRKMDAFEYGRALDRLSLAERKVKTPEYRYYKLLGEVLFRMGREGESMEAFSKSLELNPQQKDLLLKIASFQEQDRRPHFAFEAMKKYLELESFRMDDLESKEKMYRTAILAKLSGENEYAERLFTLLESDPSYAMEKESISQLLRESILDKDWEKSIQLARKFLLYFPREEVLHEYLILALRGSPKSKKEDLEKAYVDSCAVFSSNSNFAVRYGIYLQEQERMLEALATFRRAYRIYLLHSKFSKNLSSEAPSRNATSNDSLYPKREGVDKGEILYLIRQTYSFLKREHDAMAMVQLAQLMEMGDIQESMIEQTLKTYPKSRELLEFALYYYKHKQEWDKVQSFTRRLRERDEENEEKELVFVIGSFVREKLE